MSDNIFALAEEAVGTWKQEVSQAAEKLAGIDERIAQVTARQSAISEARLSGKSTPAEAAEFAALGGDLALLQKLRTSAEAEVAVAKSQLAKETDRLYSEKEGHYRRKREAVFAALHTRTQEIEKIFVKSLGATARAGREIGHLTLGTSYKISQPLDYALRLNVIPSAES